jgi:hypothetical protein
MRAWQALLLGAGMIHLTVAALFCTHVPLERRLPPGVWRALSLYAGLTGVPRHYNFFAPAVSTQARADFVLTDAQGRSYEASLDTDSFEVSQRIAMMFTFTGNARTRAELMDGWARFMLERHPEARTAEVRMKLLDIPSPTEARAGQRPAWLPFDRLVRHREAADAR